MFLSIARKSSAGQDVSSAELDARKRTSQKPEQMLQEGAWRLGWGVGPLPRDNESHKRCRTPSPTCVRAVSNDCSPPKPPNAKTAHREAKKRAIAVPLRTGRRAVLDLSQATAPSMCAAAPEPPALSVCVDPSYTTPQLGPVTAAALHALALTLGRASATLPSAELKMEMQTHRIGASTSRLPQRCRDEERSSLIGALCDGSMRSLRP